MALFVCAKRNAEKAADARVPRCEAPLDRGRGRCPKPALAAPEPFFFMGRYLELLLCQKCRNRFRQEIFPWASRGRLVTAPRMEYFEDAHGNLWLSELVRFYLQGRDDITVGRVGQFDKAHIALWYDYTAEDKDAWAETMRTYEREKEIRAALDGYAQGDPETVKMFHEVLEQMDDED